MNAFMSRASSGGYPTGARTRVREGSATVATKVRAKIDGKSTTFESKSDMARALFTAGKSVKEVERAVPGMGYAFAYGIARKMPHPDGGTFADHAATRRETKVVTQSGDLVTVQIVAPDGTFAGTVIVNARTGQVSRTKAPKKA